MPKKLLLCLTGLVVVAAGLALVCVLAIRFSSLPSAPFVYPGKGGKIIAHAGGSIDGKTVTNSKEALQASLLAGFKLIELDLLPLPDGSIVSIHDYPGFCEATNSHVPFAEMTAERAKSLPLYGAYSVMDADDINAVFSDSSLYLYIDNKDVPLDVLAASIKVDRERVLLEVDSLAEYREALERGFIYPMLNINSTRVLRESLPYLVAGEVKNIGVQGPVLRKNRRTFALLKKMGIVIFCFSVTSEGQLLHFIEEDRADFFVVDDAVPSLLQK